jgi:GNAT superfamily N-acetyltransferase
MTRTYPEEPVGGFPTPPRTVTDDEGHTVRLRTLSDRESLVEMYCEFDPDDRAQGIPPLGESAIRDWLDRVIDGDTVNVVARHDSATVGHATLVGETEYELAIFVLQAYQGCGIGTELLRTTLGVAAERGIEYVWLSVERWNRPAIALYSKLGFEQIDEAAIELEMTLWLQTGD